jgi:hypothetical protein
MHDIHTFVSVILIKQRKKGLMHRHLTADTTLHTARVRIV